jgi:CRP-like cAMP-binding protein
VPIFQLLTEEQKDALSGTLVEHHFTNRQTILSEGDSGNLFYIIKSGSVTVK